MGVLVDKSPQIQSSACSPAEQEPSPLPVLDLTESRLGGKFPSSCSFECECE